MRLILTLPVLCVLLSAATHAGETIRVAAAITPRAKIFSKVKEPFEKSSGVQLDLLPGSLGADAAFKAMDEGRADAAAIGTSLENILKLLKKQGYQPKHGNTYTYAIIGNDLIHVVVHPGTNVKELNEAQLRGLLSGKITNWKEAGGADVPVVLGAAKDLPATTAVLRERILAKDEVTSNLKWQNNEKQLHDWVAATPGALGWGPESLASGAVSSPKIPEVGRPLILISPSRPSESVAKFLKFMREDGGKLVQ